MFSAAAANNGVPYVTHLQLKNSTTVKTIHREILALSAL